MRWRSAGSAVKTIVLLIGDFIIALLITVLVTSFSFFSMKFIFKYKLPFEYTIFWTANLLIAASIVFEKKWECVRDLKKARETGSVAIIIAAVAYILLQVVVACAHIFFILYWVAILCGLALLLSLFAHIGLI